MFWVKIPDWIQYLFPQLVWKLPETERTIYFTFDDGPTPGITPLVLDFLFQYNAKATFFCTGWKAEKHPTLINSIRLAGHVIGNHGYNHKSGFCSKTREYSADVLKGALVTQSNLFRPPFGRIMPWQIKHLKSKFTIVLWSIMSMDFSSKISIEKCYKNVVDNVFPGAIIVFHDTDQASARLLKVLPQLLSFLQRCGYEFKAIDNI